MNANRKLGRGLDALIQRLPDISTEAQSFPDASVDLTQAVSGIEVMYVDPRTLRRNPQQPRVDFDENGIAELADSIRANGILQPIVVRKNANQELELIAGERRWRAALRLELAQVPVIVRDTPDDALLELALIENIQRENLNPVEEALAYQALREHHNWTQDELATRIGKKRSTVANALRILELPAVIQESLRTGRITAGHAKVLLGIHSTESQLELHGRILTEATSVRELEQLAVALAAAPQLVSEDQNGRSAPASSVRVKAPHIADEEDTWSRTLGTKVEIREGRGRGKILLHFFSTDDYERLKNLLLKMNS